MHTCNEHQWLPQDVKAPKAVVNAERPRVLRDQQLLVQHHHGAARHIKVTAGKCAWRQVLEIRAWNTC